VGSTVGDRVFGRAKHHPANQILDNSEVSGIGDRLNSLIIVTKNIATAKAVRTFFQSQIQSQ